MLATSRTVRLLATFANSARQASVDINLIAEGSPLQALLHGPSGSIRGERSIVLSAEKSFDPDDPTGNEPLAIAWDCFRSDYPVACFAGTDYGEQSGLTWKLPAALLTPDLQHTFRVTVSKDDRSASASVSLTPLPTASRVPTGRLTRQCGGTPCSNRHNTDTALALTLVPDPGFEGASISWQSDQLPDLDVGTAPDLSIPASQLPATGALLVNAVLRLEGGEQGITQLQVPLNGKPACPSGSKCLSVNTLSDTFPKASFALTASGFLDDQNDLRWVVLCDCLCLPPCTAASGQQPSPACTVCCSFLLSHAAAACCRYEFGRVAADGRREVMASGRAPTATLTGLALSTAGVYVCAVNADSTQVGLCGTILQDSCGASCAKVC